MSKPNQLLQVVLGLTALHRTPFSQLRCKKVAAEQKCCMADNEGQRKRHCLLRNNAQFEPLKSPTRGGCATIPSRYALIVSIRAPETDVDLYTAVARQIGIAVGVET